MLLAGGCGQPRLLMFGGDRAHGDSRVTEGAITEQPIERIDQRSVTAPIDSQTPDLIGLLDAPTLLPSRTGSARTVTSPLRP